jgi:hypothetical protein
LEYSPFEGKCYNGVSACLQNRSNPSVPGSSLDAHSRCATSGDVKKGQQAFLEQLPRTAVVNLQIRPSRYHLSFLFFVSTCTLISMEGYPCKHHSLLRSQPLETSLLEPTLSSGYWIRLSLMKLIQDHSFSGSIHENPFDHVRNYESLVETWVKPECRRMLGRGNFFHYPSLGNQGTGTVLLVETISHRRV